MNVKTEDMQFARGADDKLCNMSEGVHRASRYLLALLVDHFDLVDYECLFPTSSIAFAEGANVVAGEVDPIFTDVVDRL